MPSDFKADMSGIDLDSMYDDPAQPPPDPIPGPLFPKTTHKADSAEDTKIITVGDPNVLMSPLTGSLVNISDIDQLIEAATETKIMLQELRTFDRRLREKALSITEGDKKTRRLRGKEKQAVLEGCGDVYPVGSILKEAWISYPQYRDQYMRIDRIALKLVEFNKLKSLKTDDRAFNTFVKMLMRAVETGSPALPTMKVENVRDNKI